jgi:GABA permease
MPGRGRDRSASRGEAARHGQRHKPFRRMTLFTRCRATAGEFLAEPAGTPGLPGCGRIILSSLSNRRLFPLASLGRSEQTPDVSLSSSPLQYSLSMTPELSRSLQARHVSMIAVGGTIGAGLFISTGTAIAAAGPAILLSYLMTGALILLVMRMLGEMAPQLPGVHAFPEFVRAVLGPWAGFFAAWSYWYFWMMVVPVEAIAGANILHLWIPAPSGLLGLVLVTAVLALNLLSVHLYGEVEFWFASIKVIALAAFIALGTVYLTSGNRPPSQILSNLTVHGGFAPHGALAVFAGSVTAFFSLTGTEIATVAAAESVDPAHATARNTALLVIRILAFYVLSIAVILCVAPWTDNRPGFSPFALALRTMHHLWANEVMSVIILTAVISTLNSAFFVCSRVLHRLAMYGDAPAWLVVVNGRRVPARSGILCAVAGVTGVTAAIVAPFTVFAFLVNASSSLIVFVYVLVTGAYIKHRRRGIDRHPIDIKTRYQRIPWNGYVAFAGLLGILAAMALTPGLQRGLGFSLLTLLVSSIGYWLLRARGASK